MQRGELCEVVAISSRDEQSAAVKRPASRESPRLTGSYEALFADPQIDAIYNPLPNHFHVPWSIRALKPASMCYARSRLECPRRMPRSCSLRAADHPDLKVMEAFMYRHHPQWRTAKELVDAGAIGELRSVQFAFSYHNTDASNIRNSVMPAVVALMDIGCYCISAARVHLWLREPQRVCGWVEHDPKFGTDRFASGLLDFGTGTATFTCSTQLVPYQRVNILGTTGRIEIEIPFNRLPDQPVSDLARGGVRLRKLCSPCAISTCCRATRFPEPYSTTLPVPTPLNDAIANMRVIEAVKSSAASGTWV